TIQLETVICPDGQSECPDDNTCCKMTSGQYGCCPMPNAVCCSDGLHCCPSGYTCDTGAGTCTKGALTLPWVEKTEAKTIQLETVICPDSQSECPDDNTCCKMTSGQYGCCPMPNAVCCSDGLHCCPSGYTCDTGAGTCTKGALTLPWVEKTEAKTIQLETVICPDSQSECPDDNTCCKMTSGQYGCCPMPN
ncbi:progranulin-like, partial [Anneissia japonica]|uniref:progranulin-like n=1 Tax=Anneissia japonica TaxID=1529436 RepID=UPI001425710F